MKIILVVTSLIILQDHIPVIIPQLLLVQFRLNLVSVMKESDPSEPHILHISNIYK